MSIFRGFLSPDLMAGKMAAGASSRPLTHLGSLSGDNVDLGVRPGISVSRPFMLTL